MSGWVKKGLTLLLYAAAVIGGGWLLLRFILPWTAPLLLAFAIAALMEPLVRSLRRAGLPRGGAAGLVTLSVLALLVFGLIRLTGRGLSALSGFAATVPELMGRLSGSLGALEERVLRHSAALPGGEALWKTALNAITDTLTGIPAALSQQALGLLTKAAQHSPALLLFAVTAGIGSYFISADFPRVCAFLLAQLPPGFSQRMEGLGQDLKLSLGGWLRAQLILMVLTFFELLAAFLLLGVRGAGVIAAVTALVDALPVFGTGVILVPWAAVSLLQGEIRLGLGLLIAWGLVSLVRSCLQAKLLGDQIGLDPIASLLAMYVGWQVCGVWGALLFPVLLVTLRQLNDRGVIRLWRSP